MAATLDRLLDCLGSEVDDPDEETFVLFAHERPSAQNLGFVDAHATTLDLTVAGRDLTIHQSPGVLTSSRPGGTTGAVLWKITPAVAEWLASPGNILFSGVLASGSTSPTTTTTTTTSSRQHHGHDGDSEADTDADRAADTKSRNKGIGGYGGSPPPPLQPLLGPQSVVLELGCGISGVIGLVLTGKGSSSSGGSNPNSNSNSRSNSSNRSKSSGGRASRRSHTKGSGHSQTPSPAAVASDKLHRHQHQSHTKNNTVGRYVLTDQPYVAKLVQTNLEENGAVVGLTATATASTDHRNSKKRADVSSSSPIFFRPLDWETDEATPALAQTDAEQQDQQHGRSHHHHNHHHHNNNNNNSPDRSSTAPTSFDAVLACDCIYNEALVAPLVQTCVDVCRLRVRENENMDRSKDENEYKNETRTRPPTLCIVAQQLREPDVLTAWLATFHESFRVWSVSEEHLPQALWPEAGFAVHVGILRDP